MEDWANIQDVVKYSIKNLHQLLRIQTEKIRNVEQKVSHDVAFKTELDSLTVSMSNKPTFIETKKLIMERIGDLNVDLIRNQVSNKADKNELKSLYDDMTVATERITSSSNSLELLVRQQEKELSCLREQVERLRAGLEEQQDLFSRFATRKWVEEYVCMECGKLGDLNGREIKDSREKISELEQTVREAIPDKGVLDEVLAQKVDMNTLTRALHERPTGSQVTQEIVGRMDSLIDSLVSQTEATVRGTVTAGLKSTTDRVSRIEEMVQERATREQVLELCSTKVSQQELQQQVEDASEQLNVELIKVVQALQKELVEVLNKKAFKADVNHALREKVSMDQVKALLSTKVELVDIRQALARKVDVVEFQEKVLNVGEKTDLKEDADNLGKRCDELVEKLNQMDKSKVSINDMCVLLDQKASIKSVNEALKKLEDHRPSATDSDNKEEIYEMKSNFDQIMDVMSSELVLARWITSKGETTSDGAVQWDIECVNTSNDVFQLNEFGDVIACRLPGLYQVDLGFFTFANLQVQILVNGEPVFVSLPNAQSSKMKRPRHSAGSITGWNMKEFVALPPNANVRIILKAAQGEKIQGFLYMRKL